MPDSLLLDLTDDQRRAVTHRDGPLLVLAGPGSGKTTVVTRRIAQLIACGVPSWRILAMTFTNKAAGEMRRRVEELLPPELVAEEPPTVATFHSFCARQLRIHAAAAKLPPGYSIYDAADQQDAIKKAIRAADLNSSNWTPASVAAHISNAKNELLDAAGFADNARDFYSRSIARAYRAYERILRENDALDFDDLLMRMVWLLRDSSEVREKLQRRYRYLLIDEYQDTNHAQFVIAHSLAAAHGNICVVGDPDQSIYAWRGARLSNILDFEEHYPDAVVVPLGENFRSTGHIVAAAAGLIEHNRRRKHKRLYTSLEAGERPEVVTCGNEHDEAAVVAAFLRAQSAEHGVPWSRMAVLYRINALSRVLENTLRDERIPYVIARGTAFYERKEIKDALSYLRVIANPNDDVALGRIINTPARGIGRTTMDRIELFAIDNQLRLAEAMRRIRDGAGVAGLSPRAVKAISRFVGLLDELRRPLDEPRLAATGAGPLAELVNRVVRQTGLEAMYSTDTEEDRQRRENLEELVSAAAEFESERPDDDPAERLVGLLQSVALVSDADAIDPEKGSVTLMTLHAAKGLEFTALAIVGLEQGCLPHARALRDGNDLDVEEERRLCYVGMTRAKRRLLMTRAAARMHRGAMMQTMQSTFLEELPRDSVRFEDRSDVMFVEDGYGRRPASSAVDFPVGSIVRHDQFGLGQVVSITERARGSHARVSFPTVGMKVLSLEHAPLQRVNAPGAGE